MSAQILPIGMQEQVQDSVDLFIAQRVMSVFASIMNRVDPKDTEEIMDIGGACRLLKCSEPTLNSYVKQGLKKHKSKNKVYYIRKECIEFIAGLPSEDD